MEANTLYDSYREQYYEGGVSSVYLWDTEDSDAVDGGSGGGLGATGFAGCFLIKKAVAGHKYVDQGSWDSIHVVDGSFRGGGWSFYRCEDPSWAVLGGSVNAGWFFPP